MKCHTCFFICELIFSIIPLITSLVSGYHNFLLPANTYQRRFYAIEGPNSGNPDCLEGAEGPVSQNSIDVRNSYEKFQAFPLFAMSVYGTFLVSFSMLVSQMGGKSFTMPERPFTALFIIATLAVISFVGMIISIAHLAKGTNMGDAMMLMHITPQILVQLKKSGGFYIIRFAGLVVTELFRGLLFISLTSHTGCLIKSVIKGDRDYGQYEQGYVIGEDDEPIPVNK